ELPARESFEKMARAPRPSFPIENPRAPFVGREQERAALDDELRAVTAGRARVVLLMGEVGIGKSRLWQEWSRALPARVSAACALDLSCLEATQTLPFAPLT